MILRVFLVLAVLCNPARSNDTLGPFQFNPHIGVTACDELAGSKNVIKDGVGIDPSKMELIDFEKAFAACKDAIKIYPNESRFYFNLGRAEQGDRKYFEALQNYSWAAEHGNSYAMVNLGVLYELGHGTPKDYARAMNLYARAAKLGQTNAMAAIGDLYRTGRGVTVDYTKAMEWFQKSANENNPYGIFSVAFMYQQGLGVPKDCNKTVELYKNLIKMSYIRAINQMGWLYDHGICVTLDEEEAISYYKEAAELGDDYAIFRASLLQSAGYIFPADQAKSVDWLVGTLKSNNLNTVWKAAAHWYEWPGSFRIAFQQRLKSEALFNGLIDGNWSAELQVAIEKLAKK